MGAILVAAIQYRSSKAKKAAEIAAKRLREDAEKKACVSTREMRLSMDMMCATAALTIDTALTVMTGQSNNDLDESLQMVRQTYKSYEKFLRDVASERIGSNFP